MSAWLEARNILAVRLDNIGDVVMLGPALRAVKETSPDARITLMASPAGSAAATLLPWVDDVITWRSLWQDLGNLAFDPERELELIDLLRARMFDAALIFTSFSQTPHVAGYVCYLAGIPLRAGESKEFGGGTLSAELRGSTGVPEDLHQVERNLHLVESLGFAARDRRLQVAIPSEARRAIPELLARAGGEPDQPYVVVHPGASAEARRYPPERYALVADLLKARGWQVVVTGSEREADLLAGIRERAPEACYLVGGTSLAEYVALLEGAALIICNNTLPMHLADALMTPVVVLFSGTEREVEWQPRFTPVRLLRRETPCSPCRSFDCPIDLPCLDFAPEQVVMVAEEMLALHAGGVTREGAGPSTYRKPITASVGGGRRR